MSQTCDAALAFLYHSRLIVLMKRIPRVFTLNYRERKQRDCPRSLLPLGMGSGRHDHGRRGAT